MFSARRLCYKHIYLPFDNCRSPVRIHTAAKLCSSTQEPAKYSRNMVDLKDPRDVEKRQKFWEMEKEMESKLIFDQLSDDEKAIHLAHAEAVERGHFTYDDPATGDRIKTRLRHFLKGKCCGKACRHCIFDHEKVPEAKKQTRRFNSSFWVYDDEEVDKETDEKMKELYGL